MSIGVKKALVILVFLILLSSFVFAQPTKFFGCGECGRDPNCYGTQWWNDYCVSSAPTTAETPPPVVKSPSPPTTIGDNTTLKPILDTLFKDDMGQTDNLKLIIAFLVFFILYQNRYKIRRALR